MGDTLVEPLTLFDDDLVWPRLGRWLLALLPLFVLVVGVAQRWSSAPHAAVVAVALVGAIPFLADLFRVRLPLVLCGVLAELSVLALLWWWPAVNDITPFLLVLVAAIGAIAGPRWLGLAGLASAMAVPLVADAAGRFQGGTIWAVGVVAGWLAGEGVRAQAMLLREREATQQQRAAQAVAAERHRIAGEVHDVIAHSMAVTMLHLTGARLALETDDRDEAMAALLDAERCGRESLSDLRRTVHMLGDDSGTAGALPGTAELPQLVEEFRGAGLPVALEVDGDLGCVSSATGLALYRIVQESLANVARHAPGSSASVALSVSDGGARLAVSNELGPHRPAANGGGIGLSGMRQRAEALGGHLWSGVRGSRWLVETELPA